MIKTCPACGAVFETRHGNQVYCCRKCGRAAWRARNAESIREYQRAYRADNHAVLLAKQRAYRKRKAEEAWNG